MQEHFDTEPMETLTVVGRKRIHLIDSESVGKVLEKWIKIPSDKLYKYIYEKSNEALLLEPLRSNAVTSNRLESTSAAIAVATVGEEPASNAVVSGLKASWHSFDKFSKTVFGYSVSASKGLFNGTVSIFRAPKETFNTIITSTSALCTRLANKNFYTDFFNPKKFTQTEFSVPGSLSASTTTGSDLLTDNRVSEILILKSKSSSFFSMPPPFLTKTYIALKKCGDDLLYSANNNKMLLSSFIFAGLLVNELGVKYYKNKLNKQWNVLTYKEMNKKVVLVLGSMLDPITKVEVEDLLSRGFIVYVASGDVKNSPFAEELSKKKSQLDLFQKCNDSEDDFDKQSRKSGDILSDSTSDDDDEQLSANPVQKISDSDWIISSTECFSNVHAAPQDFTRLNYINSSKQDLLKFSTEISTKKWELVSIIFSYDNISNNIKTSADDFNDLILNNLMDLIASLYVSISIWPDSKVILFNNVLSKINEKCYDLEAYCKKPSLEILCNNMVETVYDTLVQSNFSNVYLVQIGVLKDINNKSLNYQFLQAKLHKLKISDKDETGSNSIYNNFLNPVQNLIMGKTLDTFFYDRSNQNILYCGKLSRFNKILASHFTNVWILNYILIRQKMIRIYYNLLLRLSNAWVTAFMKIRYFISVGSNWVCDNGKTVFKRKKE